MDCPRYCNFLTTRGILDKFGLPTENYEQGVEAITADDIRELKQKGRIELNTVLEHRPNQYGNYVKIPDDAILFQFKRRFVDYKRPWLAFTRPETLKAILKKHNAYYILCGRVHEGDHAMSKQLERILKLVDSDPFLKEHVFYLPDYDEELGRALSIGANVSINNPIVGLEACGTSWMKDIINFGLLVSTHDGGVADCPTESYLSITGDTEEEELDSLYARMEEAASAWENDFDLEFFIKKELSNYLPVISGTRMLRDYLDYLF